MRKTKILVVDDEEELCRVVKLNLEETGKYEVLTETQGAKGLEVAKDYRPDLIILDFKMPDMHGSDVAMQIQEDKEVGHIPIIFLTGLATKDDLRQKGDGDLCSLVLAKPATTEEIVNAIENNLGKRSSLNFLKWMFNKKKELNWD